LWVTLLDVIVKPGVPGSRGREAFEERGYDPVRVDDVRAHAGE